MVDSIVETMDESMAVVPETMYDTMSMVPDSIDGSMSMVPDSIAEEGEKMKMAESEEHSFAPFESQVLPTPSVAVKGEYEKEMLGSDEPNFALFDSQEFPNPSVTVRRSATCTGVRISTHLKEESDVGGDPCVDLKRKRAEDPVDSVRSASLPKLDERPDLGVAKRVCVKEEPQDLDRLALVPIKEEKPDLNVEKKAAVVKEEAVDDPGSDRLALVVKEKEKLNVGIEEEGFVEERPKELARSAAVVKAVPISVSSARMAPAVRAVPVSMRSTNTNTSYTPSYQPHYRGRPIYVKQDKKVEQNLAVSNPIEDGEFPEEPDWYLVGRSIVMGLSTCRGKKLEFNEVVHFTFPPDAWAKNKIVRFSTRRWGEIGRLPIEWTKCVIPLVSSSKVKLRARCVAVPEELQLMQEIHLYISFYIHHSVFTEGDKSSWNLNTSANVDTITHPLLTLFRLLKFAPFKKAEFTPEELDSRKRSLCQRADVNDNLVMPALTKRKKPIPDQSNDEQVISESTLNKLIGTAEAYNLKEMDPPSTLTCVLHPYQKQALYWMSESEKGIDVEQAAKTLHPCWAGYQITDKRAPAVYVNIFSGEATIQFPSATQITRGGILADAMGLGKTVMTISLILAKPGRGIPDHELNNVRNNDIEEQRDRRCSQRKPLAKAKGGTLIVCPMALLGQWKDELENHSQPGSLQVFVHYGYDRVNEPMAIAENDVVLTTYGVLSAAYKSDGDQSIFHKVQWLRIVLDEAHNIKSVKTQVSQAACTLSSYCRWCLTGTPLQNNLEDLYGLISFLHVEPWCNWAWWQKLIQKPYENGDERGMRLIKAILRPLMLRRTKDTKDKEGRPILVLSPTDIQIVECEQSEAERDFYNALFKRSKIKFDQFVAQGKILHNYASILELLLRLRQCCNHPYLVMSRDDTQQYADMNKLARQLLETNSSSASLNQAAPSRAYVEEVVEGVRQGENTECPICLESADDPVFTPCAHRMCRECLLSSWRTSAGGKCPICRQVMKKNDLITCPSENPFRVDVVNNWKESSKVSKLLDCLENLRRSRSVEKSIVFSQWTSFLDLLEIPLKKRGFGFLRFDGKLSQKNRELVLKEFSESKEKTVLLMSLKAGGVGLNLTAASNVFLMDPWWNPAVEEQAIMRIHRIGQKRTVRVKRFIVQDTVEERLQQVQARKQRMIEGALTDSEVRSARIEELKMLFR